ncbi:30S ribosomal protein S4 [Candidatus Woesearchaeota archaeon]|nr:MAG: 30S ribosomal protein S4 [Candidatus Woesearchaeota archaeon]
MGDPRRLRKKYSGPRHPWQATRLKEEKKLLYDYGLKTKKELWKCTSKVKGFTAQAKRLVAQRDEQGARETKQLLSRLARLGILKEGSTLNDVLGLTVSNVLERRLQTLVFKHKLARTVKQARQFITHGHILIGEKPITVPGYLVGAQEESLITFAEKSALSDENHPERTSGKQKEASKPKESPKAKDLKEKKKSQEKEKTEAKKTETKEDNQNTEDNQNKAKEKEAQEKEQKSEAKSAEASA